MRMNAEIGVKKNTPNRLVPHADITIGWLQVQSAGARLKVARKSAGMKKSKICFFKINTISMIFYIIFYSVAARLIYIGCLVTPYVQVHVTHVRLHVSTCRCTAQLQGCNYLASLFFFFFFSLADSKNADINMTHCPSLVSGSISRSQQLE